MMLLSSVSRMWAVAASLLHVAAIAHAQSSSSSSSTSISAGRHLQAAATPTVAELLASDPDLSMLNGALALFPELLDGVTSAFTLLAPTDTALEALAATVVGTRILTNPGYKAHLQRLLLLHVLTTGTFLAADLTAGEELIMASRDTVTVADGPSFSGPANNATAKVTAADIMVLNGVIHKIDTVLLPEFWNLDAVTLAETVDIESLKTLKKLFLQVKNSPASTAILAAARSLEVTIFAPTDEAFAALGQATIDTILADTGSLLINILQNHVVVKLLPFDALTDGLSVATLRNGPLIVSREDVLGDETVSLGESMVLETILANNGIIHTIEDVLLSADDEALLFPNKTTAAPAPPATNTTTSAAPATAPVMAPAPTAAPVMAPMTMTNTTTTSSMPVPAMAAMPTKGGDKATSMPVVPAAKPSSAPATPPTGVVAPPPVPSSTAASAATSLLGSLSLVAAAAVVC